MLRSYCPASPKTTTTHPRPLEHGTNIRIVTEWFTFFFILIKLWCDQWVNNSSGGFIWLQFVWGAKVFGNWESLGKKKTTKNKQTMSTGVCMFLKKLELSNLKSSPRFFYRLTRKKNIYKQELYSSKYRFSSHLFSILF